MKPDELPSTTREYWEKRMKTKNKAVPAMTEQMDPMAMEQLNAMRGNPNLRPLGQKNAMRQEKGKAGARLSRLG